MSFDRIAIVNRGEAAMRFIHAARDLRAAGERIETVALYTDVERNARFVREADEAHPVEPAWARPDLDLALLERALIETVPAAPADHRGHRARTRGVVSRS